MQLDDRGQPVRPSAAERLDGRVGPVERRLDLRLEQQMSTAQVGVLQRVEPRDDFVGPARVRPCCRHETGQPHTAHTTNPVPLIYIGRDAELEPIGALSDITPTMLYLMGLEQPVEMTGHALVKPVEDEAQSSLI